MSIQNNKIGFYMKIIHNKMAAEMTRDAASKDLTASQVAILGYLFKNQDKKILQKDVEEQFFLKHSTVSGILQRLESKGFIRTVVSEKDHRCKSPVLTEKSLKISEELREDMTAANQRMLAGLSEEELAALERTLEKIRNNLVEEESGEQEND